MSAATDFREDAGAAGLATADACFLSLVTDREVRRDPWDTMRRMREAAPFFRSSLGAWVATRFDDCHAVLRDPRCGKDWEGYLQQSGIADWREHPSLAYGATSLLFSNPPEHTRLRRLVAKAFTPRTVARLEPRMAARVDALLDPVAEAGAADLLDALAFPLPVGVIGELLDVPEEDHALFREAVRVSTRTLEIGVTPQEILAADEKSVWMQGYFLDLIRRRRARPGEDMISGMLAVEEGGDRLSDAEIASMSSLLFAAGFETTTNLLGNGIFHLLESPGQLAILREDPGLLHGAVEEMLRFDGSILLSTRAALEDTEVAGHAIEAGSTIVTLLGAANRDPAKYADPDRLDLRRSGVEPLSFGSGIHYCLGASLARAEARIAIGRLLERFPRLELDGTHRFRDQLVFRGLEGLRIRCSTTKGS